MRWSFTSKTFKYKQTSLTPLGLLTLAACGGGSTPTVSSLSSTTISGTAVAGPIAKNHAFVDGNKRPAWVTCNIFIEINGGELVFDKLEAVRFVEGVAGGAIDFEGARDWIAGSLSVE
jgi:death-on-curing protein